MTQLTLTVTPADALIDVPRRIVIQHADSGAYVEITARTRRAGGILWQSQATFMADEQGNVDIATATPVAGDYNEVSAMGLIWSQRPVGSDSREIYPDDITEPLITELSARVPGGVAQAQFIQRLAGTGVTRMDVRENGLVGTLYRPSGAGPHPALMVLNGSGGGINEPRAALYASHGYAALALAYFKAPGLSDYISNTPLEYFQTGLAWIRQNVNPAHDFVALSGQSRGGELVLLLGATFPEAVSAVIGYVPGAVVHSGQNAADPEVGREGPAWLLGGKPLTHVWENNRTASWKPFDEGPAPHRHDKAILTALQDKDAVARARIPVEKIRGPVLLLSATDDGSWPSSLYSKMVKDKLEQVGHRYPVQWCDYENAGHSIVFPYVPTTQLVYSHPVSKRVSTGGGTPSDNARADEKSWAAVLEFLEKAVVVKQSS